MRKWLLFSILALLTTLSTVLPCVAQDENSFAVGPAKLNVGVATKGSNTTYVFITSYVNGTLIVGTENLPFSIEPTTIPITTADRNRKVELTVHGNTSLTAGQYLGKLTLLLQTGSNVAHGVKINANVTQEMSENEPTLLDQVTQSLAIIGVVVGILAAVTFGLYVSRNRRRKLGKLDLNKK